MSQSTLGNQPFTYLSYYRAVDERILSPFIMTQTRPNLRSKILNTDHQSLRLNLGLDKQLHTADSLQTQDHNLLIGGSTAFGVGASSDRTTISSYLTEKSDIPCINFGSRTWTLQQSLIHFQYSARFSHLKRLYILAGVNDLALALQSTQYFYQFGSYYNAPDYIRLNSDRKITPQELSILMLASDTKPRVGQIIKSLRRGLDIFLALGTQFEFEVHFLLQPFIPWTSKRLSPEEEVLLSTNNHASISAQHDRLIHTLTQYYELFRTEIEHACLSLDINFIDLNPKISKDTDQNDWVFVDEVHLTDFGNRYVANII